MNKNEGNVLPLPPLWAALVPICFLITLLAAAVYFFGSDSSSGATQIALLMTASLAAAIAVYLGHSWVEIETAIIDGITVALRAILILLVVGALIGTWIAGGIVPTLIVYGLEILDPAYFYLASCIICAIVSLSTGSSWTTAGTVGVALIGVAQAFDLSPAITAGAIISGAYFGDKMSPLSDSTNLTAAVARADLFDHIRNMVWTTAPGILIALVLYAALGFGAGSSENMDLSATTDAINSIFYTGWPMLIPLLVVLGLAALRMPPIPTLLLGTLLGAVYAIVFQTDALSQYGVFLGGGDYVGVKAMWTAFFAGFKVVTGNEAVDELLSRGGMSSMLTTVWLILSAMILGAVLEHTGMIARLIGASMASMKRVGSLIATTVSVCIGTNIIASDQYIAIVVPGRMLAPTYERLGLAPSALSRTLEDSATLTSPLVPWNTCGAFMAATLGVATFDYLPFCFLGLLTPLIAILYGYLGIKIVRREEKTQG
ncbi:Na+/H+ antiporter NhaC [Emcibacter sp.]|uniref:Na+/H+ antiporter NhaC n=1 Tax=Emcibacter sp. TaxID=1979954 RepID=UPI002AA79A81|nr:Na+/H+ antiporter NhaC [Emcibacter sp.]